jgi:porphobilinogen synthase
MVQEIRLAVTDLIYPLFVVNGRNVKKPIDSMPGVYQLSVDNVLKEMKEIRALGIPAVILFGIPAYKDAVGTSAYDPGEAVQRSARAIKEKWPEVIVITDVCLCEYTDHGHCGIIRDGEIVNDSSLEVLAKIAVSHVSAGADIVAPSDMMDGRVAALRSALDRENFEHALIMSYTVKYASTFYGPFREAAGSAPRFGDRRSYQMNPANSREALREVSQDLMEGADIVMVKPALSYLDIVRAVKENTCTPVAAFNVSGEYSMVKAAASRGWIDEKSVVLEQLLSIKRAGADLIITYHAREAARWLMEGVD